MNRERAKELLPIIQAFAEGKEIQSSDRCRKLQWEDCPEPNWVNGNDYRVKPEPITTLSYRRYVKRTQTGRHIVQMIREDICCAKLMTSKSFVAWIDTEWQTHEIPQE